MSAGVTGIATGRRRAAGGLVHGLRIGDFSCKSKCDLFCARNVLAALAPTTADAGINTIILTSATLICRKSRRDRSETPPRRRRRERKSGGGLPVDSTLLLRKALALMIWHHLVVISLAQLTSSTMLSDTHCKRPMVLQRKGWVRHLLCLSPAQCVTCPCDALQGLTLHREQPELASDQQLLSL